MEARVKDNKLEEDLRTIVECEVDSANQEGNDDNDFDDQFNHLELRHKLYTEPIDVINHQNESKSNAFEEMK